MCVDCGREEGLKDKEVALLTEDGVLHLLVHENCVLVPVLALVPFGAEDADAAVLVKLGEDRARNVAACQRGLQAVVTREVADDGRPRPAAGAASHDEARGGVEAASWSTEARMLCGNELNGVVRIRYRDWEADVGMEAVCHVEDGRTGPRADDLAVVRFGVDVTHEPAAAMEKDDHGDAIWGRRRCRQVDPGWDGVAVSDGD